MKKKFNLYQPADVTREHKLSGMPLASFTRRSTALLIDFLFAGLFFLFLTYIVGSIGLRSGIISPNKDILLKFTFYNNWYSIIWLVVYFSLTVYLSNGLTLGKWICRIRIVSLTHTHISFWHSIERALGYGASALEAGFGFLQYFLRKDRRTVHDRIAETIVISMSTKISE
ncbi:MAG: RDD family protein [Ignavibacteriaceae bacterium]|nr:RDD family protein [Ignavibacteriaceae bacterium]